MITINFWKKTVLIALCLQAALLLSAGDKTPARPTEGTRTLPELTLTEMHGLQELPAGVLEESNRLLVERMAGSDTDSPEFAPPEPHILSIDRNAGKSPEALLNVLNKEFALKQWNEAYRRLFFLLKEDYTAREQSRIYYYLGQCSYFAGEKERSFFEFLMSSGTYPRESAYWQNIILSFIGAR